MFIMFWLQFRDSRYSFNLVIIMNKNSSNVIYVILYWYYSQNIYFYGICTITNDVIKVVCELIICSFIVQSITYKTTEAYYLLLDLVHSSIKIQHKNIIIIIFITKNGDFLFMINFQLSNSISFQLYK